MVGFLMFLALWQLLAMMVRSPILPSPVSVIPLFLILLPGELGLHLLASSARVFTAICISIVTAVPVGLVLGQSKRMNRIFSPLISIVYPIPKIVLLPVVYVLIGITDISKIFLISLILFFQILVVVRDEAANLPNELILSVKSLGAGRMGLFFFVYFPASIPAMLTAIRISIGTAIAVLFIAEQSMTDYGLGYFIIVKTYQVLLYREMYSGILAIGLLGLFLYYIIDFLDRRINKHLFV